MQLQILAFYVRNVPTRHKTNQISTTNVSAYFTVLKYKKKTQINRYLTYIIIYFMLREGFCPPIIFHGRAFVRPVIFTGRLLSALSFSREGFCPPYHFYGRAFVRPVIFTGELLSALSFLEGRAFVREGFCPTLVHIPYI
jgi:hypothetical protein